MSQICYVIGMWTVVLTDEAANELNELPDDQRARFARIAGLIREHGLDRVRFPHVRHLKGELWEIRLKGADGISRALYVVATGRRVVVVRVFTKKTEKTPGREIALALTRAKDIT
jgi:phage-related protein